MEASNIISPVAIELPAELPPTPEQVADGVTISKGTLSASFHPEQMLFPQQEAIERELVRSNYSNIQSEYFAESQARSAERLAKARLTDPSATKESIGANEEEASYIQAMLNKLHTRLVETGARAKLVSILLVPDGMTFSTASMLKVEKELLPKMTTKEVQEVLQSFFAFVGIFSGVSQTYLVGNLPTPKKD
jgi:hypothetical protein